jgi:hypothetical protein
MLPLTELNVIINRVSRVPTRGIDMILRVGTHKTQLKTCIFVFQLK